MDTDTHTHTHTHTMQDDDTEMVQLLREDGEEVGCEEVGCEEGMVEVLGDSRRREDNGVLYREVALPVRAVTQCSKCGRIYEKCDHVAQNMFFFFSVFQAVTIPRP